MATGVILGVAWDDFGLTFGRLTFHDGQDRIYVGSIRDERPEMSTVYRADKHQRGFA
ncbi:MAG: hypothetical protein O2913_10425 [Chloroflexi bacterium]|nr:hypothetical protein [Chloroflexota bacterium]